MIDKEFTIKVNNKKIYISLTNDDLEFYDHRNVYMGNITWSNDILSFILNVSEKNSKKTLFNLLQNCYGIKVEQKEVDKLNYLSMSYENYLNLLTFLKLKGE